MSKILTLTLLLSSLSCSLYSANVIINKTSNNTTIQDNSSSINTGINLGASNSKSLLGDNKLTTITRTLSDFNSVIVNIPFTVNITCNGNHSVEISADTNITPLISTEIKNSTLVISTTKSFNTKSKITISVNAPQLNSIQCSGAGNLTVIEINTDKLNVTANGAAEISLTGKVQNFQLNSAGSSTINAKNLISKDTKLQMTGAGEAQIFASNNLNAHITGAADVTYYGNPKHISKNDIIAGSLEPGN